VHLLVFSTFFVRLYKEKSNLNLMKKFTLVFLAMICMAGLMAQSRLAKPPVKAIPLKAIKNQDAPSQPVNQVVNSKAVMEDVLGNTYYDMQTNASVDTRITVYPDGTIGTAWIRGTTNSNDRGTGYNYFDGTAWGPAPTSRIENDRTGWPSYAPLGPSGEIVIAHLNDGLKVSKRDTKGQGTWNQSVMMGPAGATDISWPRIMTNGPNHNYVHMLVNTYVVYEGLDLAILYYRSLDGGLTWDKNGVVLPQMTSADYDGFNGDQMAWGTPHGDTIYFVVSGPWIDSFIMKSFDNGNTWTKVPILSNANKKLAPGTTDVPPFTSSDGSCAVEMDNDGVFHVAFGIGGGFMEGGSQYIYVNRNGLVYWNSTMPMLQDSLDLDTLEAHGQLLGAVYNGPNPGDTIIDVPSYRVGLSSMPQISVDDYNNVFFLWSAATPGNPSPDPYNYRHIWGRAKFANQNHMTDQMDLNEGVMYLFTEYVYPAVAKRIRNNNIELMYQSAPEPGSNIVSTTISQHECNIEHRQVPTSMFIPAGTSPSGVGRAQVGIISPNPVREYFRIPVSLLNSSEVSVTVSTLMGQTVLVSRQGTLPTGSASVRINCGGMASGMYIVSITIGNEVVTRKIMIE
jgi:hypothetical protein